MYNAAVLKHLISEFGIEETMVFCKMEARRFELQASSYLTSSTEAAESYYERDWWQLQFEQLSTQLTKDIKEY